MISIKVLRELCRINPDISGKALIELAECYVEVTRSCVDNIKNIGDSARFFYNGRVEIKDYKKGCE